MSAYPGTTNAMSCGNAFDNNQRTSIEIKVQPKSAITVTYPTARKIQGLIFPLPPTRAGGTKTKKENLFEFRLECYEKKKWRMVHEHQFKH